MLLPTSHLRVHRLFNILTKLSQSFWVALVWTIIIFILLVIPTDSVPEEELFDISDFDKIVHCLLFGFFLWFWANWYSARYGLLRTKFRSVFVILVITAAYGAGMEYYQKYFTSREFDTGDIIADSLGGIVAAVIFLIVNRKK